MRKTIIMAVIACILGIVLLGGLAFYIPRELGNREPQTDSEMFTGFNISTETSKTTGTVMSETVASEPAVQAPASEKLPGNTLPSDRTAQELTEEGSINPETDLTAAEESSGTIRKHQIIWVGDSRTLGLRDALHKTDRVDDDIFVGKVGEGVHWFQEEGIQEMDKAIREHPDLPVVMNLGVNDPQLADEYIETYRDVFKAYPDTTFYILSVNPLDEEFLIEDGLVEDAVFEDINSLNVARMNVRLKEEFESRYIDSASYLKSDGFDTVDGLHFSTQTYLKIHDFVVKKLF